ncbi:MAG: hypothetical protein Rubg2KO_16340 [Rubricoccaceae bacterium]
MRLRSVLLTLLGVVFLASGAQSQAIPVQVKLDTGTFLYDGSESLLEVYLSFEAKSLPYQAVGDGAFSSALPMTLALLPIASSAPDGAERTPVYEQEVEYRFQVPDTTSLQPGQVFVEQLRTTVAPGDYELALTMQVPENGEVREFGLVRDVVVPAYALDPAVSSIQVATSISQATDAGASFVKSGLVVRPNPDTFYGQSLGSVPYYVEVYNPGDDGTNYTLLTFLSETNQPNPLPGKQSRTERPARQVDVVVGQMDVSDLPSGIYTLNVAALGPGNEAIAESRKRIYVINPDIERPGGVPDLDYEETIFAVMGTEELDLNLDHALVLATQPEQNQIDEVRDGSDDAKKGLLASFWRSRDTSPNPLVNDAYEQFYERLRIVNDRFREPGTQAGFKSDRGRVFLVYGSPANVTRNSFDQELIPHEVWTYESIPGEGAGLFVFADRFGANQFELIHSTVTGEVSLGDWQRELRTLSGTGTGGSSNSGFNN